MFMKSSIVFLFVERRYIFCTNQEAKTHSNFNWQLNLHCERNFFILHGEEFAIKYMILNAIGIQCGTFFHARKSTFKFPYKFPNNIKFSILIQHHDALFGFFFEEISKKF